MLTMDVIDDSKIGTAGYPIHWRELGLQPPMKTITVEQEAPPIDPAIENTPNNLRAYAAQRRYAIETGGVTIASVRMPTDRATQAKLTAAFLLAQFNPATTFSWKLDDGTFAELTGAQLQPIAVAVGAFVHSTFAAEQAVCAAIDSGAIVTRAQIDAFAWPSN